MASDQRPLLREQHFALPDAIHNQYCTLRAIERDHLKASSLLVYPTPPIDVDTLAFSFSFLNIERKCRELVLILPSVSN